MAGLLPPDHIEYYKRQVDLKTENLRTETIEFVKNFCKVNNQLPCFPWTFAKTYQTLRLLSDTIGHRNSLLDRLPTIIANELQQTVGPLPPGYVPVFSTDGKTLNEGMIPNQLHFGDLETEAMLFYQQMFTYIHSHYLIHKTLPQVPHSYTIGYRYLQLKKLQTQSKYPLDNLPNQLRLNISKCIGYIPQGYIPEGSHITDGKHLNVPCLSLIAK